LPFKLTVRRLNAGTRGAPLFELFGPLIDLNRLRFYAGFFRPLYGWRQGARIAFVSLFKIYVSYEANGFLSIFLGLGASFHRLDFSKTFHPLGGDEVIAKLSSYFIGNHSKRFVPDQ
jgi:hypothetical protein